MAYRFASEWPDEIAEESTKPEYQTAVVRIEDPSLVVKDYNVDTAVWTITGDPVIYPVGGEAGQARLIGVRWGVFTGGESQANTATISTVRMQLPYQALGRVRRGMKVFVVSVPRNPALESLIFTVTSDLQGSSAAARTFELSLDGDVEKAVPSGP
jgi:hypothetical protein